MRLLLILFCVAIGQFSLPAQSAFRPFEIPAYATHTPLKEIDFSPSLITLEAGFPGGNSYRSYLSSFKQQLSYAGKQNTLEPLGNADKPLLLKGFEGNFNNIGIPCDNALAISNEGILISAINSDILFYDTNTDSILFSTSLEAFADTFGFPDNMYDPKLLYDHEQNRFIMVWLSGNSDTTSHIIVCFSSSPNPLDPWHFYALPGDPKSQGTWSDFPAVSLTSNSLIITINALINDTFPPNVSDSWKYLFRETLIWQIDKADGYSGQNLTTNLIDNISIGGLKIRNLCPIPYALSTEEDVYFLSNRNFDASNDTFFLLQLSGGFSSPSVVTQIIKADQPYELSPDGKQFGNQFLQTNDSRVLAGFFHNGNIHFVMNSSNAVDNRSGIAHGILSFGVTISIQLHFIGFSDLDIAYPNIAWTGKYPTDEEAIIVFNHTSVDTFAGTSAIFWRGESGYSERLTMKTGDSHVSLLSGPYERWGDYSGLQTKFNEPGVVWTSGFFGTRRSLSGMGFPQRVNWTWIASLKSPDESVSSIPTPLTYSLPKVYPNPSSQKFSTEFEWPEKGMITIDLVNVTGMSVKQLYRGFIEPGNQLFSFSIDPLPAGTYFLILKSPHFSSSIEVVKQ